MELEPHGPVEFKETEFLWRYMDIQKFLSFITHQELWFSRLDQFDDPLDGLTERTIGEMAWYEQLEGILNSPNCNFNQEQREAKINEQNKRRAFIKETSENSQTAQFANCWYIGEKESFAMWGLYARKDSVAIKYDPNKLLEIVLPVAESYVAEDFGKFLYGRIVYKNIWPFNFFKEEGERVNFSAFKKDSSYDHEKEFRFVVVARKAKKGEYHSFRLPMGDISRDAFEIYASPHMSDWQYENIATVLDKFGLKDKLFKSLLRVKSI